MVLPSENWNEMGGGGLMVTVVVPGAEEQEPTVAVTL
jgi:hypothetical protein